jgi:hypothetical protein
MHALRLLCSLIVMLIPLVAVAQLPENVIVDDPDPFMFQLRVQVGSGTDRVQCFVEGDSQIVGSAEVAGGTEAIVAVPILMPDPAIRCVACNGAGCSDLSPNAAVVAAVDVLDRNRSGHIDVSDMIMCVNEIRDNIF